MIIHDTKFKTHIPYSRKALERLIYVDRVDLADIDTTYIRDMSDLFSVDYHDPEDIRKVNNPSGMRKWNTANTFNFQRMFYGSQFGGGTIEAPTWRGTRLIDFRNWDMRNALFIDSMFEALNGWKPYGLQFWTLPKVMDANSFISQEDIADVVFDMYLPDSCRGQDMVLCHPEIVPHYVDTQAQLYSMSVQIERLGKEIKELREDMLTADDLDLDAVEQLSNVDVDALCSLAEYDLSGIDDLSNAVCGMDYRDIRRAFEDVAENGTACERLDELERKVDRIEETLDRIDGMIDESEDIVDPAEIHEMAVAFRSIRAILRGERND